MKLQKLVYFAYGWYGAYNDDPPLFEEAFYAWRLGIIVKDLYEKYSHCKDNPLIISSPNCPALDTDVTDILRSVWKAYAPHADYTLNRAIRNHATWRQAQRSFEWEFKIAPAVIRDAFKKLMLQNAHASKK
jgi:uncharacterized phage-associated protein